MGCLVLAGERTVAGHSVLVLAAVTGQPGDDPLRGANRVDERLLDAVAAGLREVPVTPSGLRVGTVTLPVVAPPGSRSWPPAPISLLAWPGQVPRLDVSTRALHTGMPAGATAGTLSASIGRRTGQCPRHGCRPPCTARPCAGACSARELTRPGRRGGGTTLAAMRARAPASAANLGPGFDVLAVALDLYVEVEVEPASRLMVRSEGEGADLVEDDMHLAARVAIDVVGHDRLAVTVRSAIPVARGLGSSAALAVAAAAAAGSKDPLGVAARDRRPPRERGGLDRGRPRGRHARARCGAGRPPAARRGPRLRGHGARPTPAHDQGPPGPAPRGRAGATPPSTWGGCRCCSPGWPTGPS